MRAIGKLGRVLALASMLLLASATAVSAQEGDETIGRDPAYEQEIYDRLAEINPEAVAVFQQATSDLDQGNFAAAREGFLQVLEMAEGFPDAARRLSSVEIVLGQPQAALGHANMAFDGDPSAYNRSALAYALLAAGSATDLPVALQHAQMAADALPEDPFAQYVLGLAAYASQDVEALDQASQAMVRLFPEDPLGHFFAGLVAAENSHWLEAEDQLTTSLELGMPADEVEQVLASGVRTQARIQRSLRTAGYGLAGWAGGLAVLFVVGTVLSSVTLREVSQAKDGAGEAITRGERAIRSIYRAVIGITSAYFYVSIPMLILAVLGMVGAAYYLFQVVGQIPLRLAAFMAIAALYTIYAIVRSIFARSKDRDPGRALSRDQAPRLWSLTEEVAKRLRTEPIEAIYVTPGTEIGVLERGGMLAQTRGQSRRELVLGLGALPGMTQGQFRAILAHEYGHFSNRDTAGGSLARRVRFTMHQLALRLALAGQARIYNPAWLFVNGFYRIFQRITLGASRLQEILADRYAALAYGADDLANGLTHIMRQSLQFNMQVSEEIDRARQAERELANLYSLPPLETGTSRAEFEAQLKVLMERPTSAYDSHPAPKDRLELLTALGSRSSQFGDDEPVWSLIPEADQLQAEMTALVQRNLEQAAAGSKG